MDETETKRLLRARSALTSQPYSPDVVAVWTAALAEHRYESCSVALVAAARVHDRVTPAHVLENIPRPPVSTEHRYRWDGPTDTGRNMAAQIHAHLRREHDGTRSPECPTCGAMP